jgi:hypothetical protein
MGEPVKTTFDDTITLMEACHKYNADIKQVVVFFESIGRLSEEKAREVLYVATVIATAGSVPPLMPA